MVFKTKGFLPVAIMGLALSATANSAMAASVALSMNEISSFQITGIAYSSAFTFSNDTAATEDGGTSGVDAMDAPAACIGVCAGWENEFYPHTSYKTEFSYGDAQIINDDVLGKGGAASSIGEVFVADGIAHASGSSVMTSTIFKLESSILNFNFIADALMQTSISGAGLSNAANMFFNISLTNETGTEVFSWSPDGEIGGIFGGTEKADSFDLNYGITGNTLYNPNAGTFSAYTNKLASGSYTLNIKMENQVNGVAVVPVPAAVWLFGSGLLGLIGVARRKKS